MTTLLVLEQMLNGLQFGVMLFLMAAGLTLVFGIMDLINLAHGSLYMVGAFLAVTLGNLLDSYVLGVLAALPATLLVGIAIEFLVLRRLYERSHLDQVLATFGLILFLNEAVRLIWGPVPQYVALPAFLSGQVELLPGVPYPSLRLAILAVGVAVALLLWWLVGRTRTGMLIRAGAANRTMLGALGVNVRLLFTAVFGLGAALAGLAGMMAGPIVSVQSGMGEEILIVTFVVIVIGGLGSVRGAFMAALLVGLIDTLGRAFLPDLLVLFLPPDSVQTAGATIAAMLIYILMAAVLFFRPQGLFPPRVR